MKLIICAPVYTAEYNVSGTLQSSAQALYVQHASFCFINSEISICGLQAWARNLHDSSQYATASAGQQTWYLFPFKADEELLFLGFLMAETTFFMARELRNRILLVLDIDETLINAREFIGNMVCPPCH